MIARRGAVRPRYARIAVLAASLTVSVVAALAGLGVLTTGSAEAGGAVEPASYPQSTATTRSTGTDDAPPAGEQPGQDPSGGATSGESQLNADSAKGTSHPDVASEKAVPADSGSGRRVVFSQSRQRVWLIGRHADHVQRTYLVSGSVTHNLQPGTYSVYSTSRWAVGVDDSGVMQYFVRFTRGPTGAAIGFHSIPSKNGVPLQTRARLGTPQSHGCIRQNLPDAVALWSFAPVGTKVVVVA